jgi:hypothetical protein
MDRLETQLARLVEQQVISGSQAQVLLEAAQADRLDRQSAPGESAPRSSPKSSAVLEVLGYVGGALVLGAVIMLGSLFWDDLGSTGRKLIAVASVVVPALGGAALIKGRARPELGRILLALACYAAGFAYLVVIEDHKFVVSAAVVVLTSAIGAVLLRSGAFLVSGWSGAMLLVCAVVFNVIDVAAASSEDYRVVPAHLAIGFLLAGVALAGSGLLLSRTLAWSPRRSPTLESFKFENPSQPQRSLSPGRVYRLRLRTDQMSDSVLSPGHWPASVAGRRALSCRWTPRMANGCRWLWQPSSARHCSPPSC